MNRFFRVALGLTVVIALVTAFALAASAQAQDPLVQVLVNKGVLSADEAKSLSGTPAEQRDRLVQLLRDKGVISAAEYKQIETANESQPAVKTAAHNAASSPSLMPAVLTTATAMPQEKKPAAKPPAFIAASAPIRVLQLEPSKPEGLIPDIRVGKVGIKLYGFLKASAVYDSSSPGGNDFPLPGFLNDTGPDGSPEFHVKARSARVGAAFEWPDVSPKVAITGKIEFDFEGNFSRVNNRNISSIRSNMPSIRLAYGRIDYRATDDTSVYALFGQDWTPFGSSILPNSLETTGLGIGFGSLYTRDPQVRGGFTHKFGGNRNFTFGMDVAAALPAFGDLPPISDQLAYGERQGTDSARPEMQGRIVFQWQLDKAKGVAPAQIIFSGMHASRAVEITAAGVPAAYAADFPQGARISSSRYGWTAGFQLPTHVVTLIANYYRGTGLRWYFAGQVYPEFSDTNGMTDTVAGSSIDGTGPAPVFGLLNGLAIVAPQLEPRAQGGFVELGIPLSRVFNAEPGSRAAGWSMNLHYGQDSVFARDVRRLAPKGGRGRGDWAFANLLYKINPFVTLGYELSYYRTKAVAGTTAPFLPLYKGIPSETWHDVRSEFATIFTF